MKNSLNKTAGHYIAWSKRNSRNTINTISRSNGVKADNSLNNVSLDFEFTSKHELGIPELHIEDCSVTQRSWQAETAAHSKQ